MTVRINYDTNIEDEEIYLFNEKDDKTPYYEKGTSYNYFDEEENLSFWITHRELGSLTCGKREIFCILGDQESIKKDLIFQN